VSNLFVGKNRLDPAEKEISGQFVTLENETFYEIKHFDNMPPFFISLSSDSDHWMYISSTGGLTAGRKNPDLALFPYYTDDKIHDAAEYTGSKTIIHLVKNGDRYLWEPFSDRYKGVYKLERSILKSTTGNKVIFSEKNFDLGMTFRYAWMNSNEFGWIKKSELNNDTKQVIEVELIDGLQNILPYGTNRLAQNVFSTLVDAYKKTELIEEAGLALFRMESIMVDRAEPAEALRVNTVWSFGLEKVIFLLSSKQLDNFRKGHPIIPELESKGVRGAFFVSSKLTIEPDAGKKWYTLANTEQDAVKVNNLIDFIRQTKNIPGMLEDSIDKGTQVLRSIVSAADGIQKTADKNRNARHFSNVLFNTMRGGIYNNEYTIVVSHFEKHVKHFNKNIREKYNEFLSNLQPEVEYANLEKSVSDLNDPDFYRLFLEYLPLTFSRRHGDPSRPWNLFDIRVRDEDGNKLLAYQGNWRDIFQNWEALSLSYPLYIQGIIAKFLNASTADGYNPYKVTNDGIEWELIEPDNPWSNIGYWGDHQIIYLLRLMEISRSHFPDRLLSWLDTELFAYANVPYRFKSYEAIVADPKNSIFFEEKLHKQIEERLPEYGADAKLITDDQGKVKLVSFTEKILVSLLTKLSNFIPEAGIWMNTLRPEWNDANNALVGYGTSMVTLYYLRRYIAFVKEFYPEVENEKFELSEEVACFCEDLNAIFQKYTNYLEKGFTDQRRKNITDDLGKAGHTYRSKIYRGFSGEKKPVERKSLITFFELILQYIDQSISANKRSDGMYHAYNLIAFSEEGISIRRLYEMLEGQVAVLSSGKLHPEEALELLNVLRRSKLYRPDQDSYLLYPDKQLPKFLEKNRIPAEELNKIPILNKLIETGDSAIISRDKKGQLHFNAGFINSSYLKKRLEALKNSSVFSLSESEEKAILDLYEKLFNHQSFTGRSGTFYKYEGLGSIYWHMVSKLLLSVGETILRASEENADSMLLNQLARYYFALREGLGVNKSPLQYGSFPFDPYSHTPGMAGVQQPGMTGQVKEDIISRFIELGISVKKGRISIRPLLLHREEFIDPLKQEHLPPYLSFTYCAIHFVYLLDKPDGIDIFYHNGRSEHVNGYTLTPELSLAVFNRDPGILKIVVHLDPAYQSFGS
jgi:hypothetical protein